MSRKEPKITFGMIVLNGEPFIRYNLRALYPFAHQIIIVEGACRSAEAISNRYGHSIDGTLDTVRKFQREEDPHGRVALITAEDEGYPDGFWPEKDEMSQAYAKRSGGNYLWQVDVDEFYLPEDMRKVREMLKEEPEIKSVAFPMLTFWGDVNYVVDGFYLRSFMARRVFEWKPGYRYVSHRPPTVVDENGREVGKHRCVSGRNMKRKNIYLYHYEILLPKQVFEKAKYYSNAEWLPNSLKGISEWLKKGFITLEWRFRPHMVYSYLSWLKKYAGKNPPQVVCMMEGVRAGNYPGISIRNNDDVEKLLALKWYQASFTLLGILCSVIDLWLPILSWGTKASRRFRRTSIKSVPRISSYS